RRDDDRAQVPIHLVRRDHHTRPSLPDLTSKGRFEPNPEDLEAPDAQRSGHSHSDSSNSVGVSALISASSPAAAICANAASHPCRARAADLTTNAPSATDNSTLSPRRASSINARGILMPRELPMRTILARTPILLNPPDFATYTQCNYAIGKCLPVIVD